MIGKDEGMEGKERLREEMENGVGREKFFCLLTSPTAILLVQLTISVVCHRYLS